MKDAYRKTGLVAWLVLLLIAGCRGPQATGSQLWTVVALLTRGEQIHAVTETVEVRHCPVPDRKTVECSAGTASNFSASLGADIGVSAVAQVSLDPSIGVELGFNRTSGETLALDTPPESSIYVYVVRKEYRIVSGKTRMRAAGGQEREGSYVFEASCALQTESRRQLTCEGIEVTPTSPPTSPPALTDTPVPAVTFTPTPTTTLQPTATPRPSQVATPTRPRPTRTPTPTTPAPAAPERPTDTPQPAPTVAPQATDSRP